MARASFGTDRGIIYIEYCSKPPPPICLQYFLHGRFLAEGSGPGFVGVSPQIVGSSIARPRRPVSPSRMSRFVARVVGFHRADHPATVELLLGSLVGQFGRFASE
jgi:hypothetical protein